ncbi:MAG TPA: RNA methyltransferase [Burkholderiales bacterium]|nr:RNA methyltransferase [Burkholderiales bacterium]
MTVLRSRDNPRLRRWQRLSRDSRLRRAEKRALIEGPHLLAAYLDSGGAPLAVMVSESVRERAELGVLVRRAGLAPVVLADALFGQIAEAETPAGIAAEIPIPEPRQDLAASPCCAFLEGLQDAGNVGAILRSAAAFGVSDVVLGRGCADPWSPKALRAGMGGHFALRLAQSDDLADAVVRFGAPVLCTVPRGGSRLDAADLRGRTGWIFGAEGQGVSEALAARAHGSVTIPMPGPSESLNVAAAAAICFYERARQLSTRAARS